MKKISAKTTILSHADRLSYSMRAQAVFFATVAMILSSIILLGWMLNVPVMRSLVPGFVPTSPMTAVCFFATALSVFLAQFKGVSRIFSLVLVWGVLAFCVVVGLGHLGLSNNDLDQALFTDQLGLTEGERQTIIETEKIAITIDTVRMAPHTVLGLILVCAALLLSRIDKEWAAKLAQVLAFGVILITGMVLFGYALSAGTVKSFGMDIPMAFATALNFVAVAGLVFSVRKRDGLLYPLLGKSAASSFARRMLAVGFILPPIITTLRVNGVHFGIVGSEVSSIAATSILVLAFVVAFWRASFVLKQSEEKLEATNEGLRLRAIELETAHAEADRANKAKSEFLSRMSHELRTPMNAVIGYAQLLEMPPHDEEVQESAQAILKGGRHLLGLIDEILDIARIEAGKLTLSGESISVAEAVRHSIELVRMTADAKGVSIEMEGRPDQDISVHADRQRLIQILLNLLSNAIKYNQRDGRVGVRVSEKEDLVCIHVSDTGRGIDEQGAEKLFIPFERIDEHYEEGTGLGLALSRRLAELMGGKLYLESSNPEGSMFTVELPRSVTGRDGEEGEEGNLSPFELAQGARPLKVVYIEDNLSNLQLLTRVFERIGGIELHSAMQASVGLDMIRNVRPDLVLLDLHLPDAHGSTVLEELKRDSATAEIDVIVISADATDSEQKRLLGMGARSYITKPLDLSLLMKEVGAVREEMGPDE